ncbi:GH36-type glycosyl hydrolase domain-containing protein [Paenibacillus phocaensis]|uniref:GH36-type glycosyl hydrolase domain-containing protein n=1 Tax=Paenibacillus phocaensis TaxID=1776378 RepID=UPI000839D51F|nr:glycosyl hydrolase family 65 protein [Paenibacillus phocaensis]
MKPIDPQSYYSFRDAEKEIEFHRHDMPTPWMNYLSNGTFHTMLSHAGGGVAFYKSPQIWRITRYRFFHLPMDRSGPYIYIQDADSGTYWCPTNEPAADKPEAWKSAHGLGYTRFEAKRDGVAAQTLYFVGPYENSLIWKLSLSNDTAVVKELNVYAYVEFGMMEFMRELQWQCYNKHQVSVQYHPSEALVYRYGVENQPKPEETPLVYFASDAPLSSYDGDREEFIGSYRSEANPAAIEEGGCRGSTLMGGDPCGALQFKITLQPGESKVLHLFLGTARDDGEVAEALARSREAGFAELSFQGLRTFWDGYLGAWECRLPDPDAERMLNIWNPYQAHRNFLFSRNISFYATGTFRGVGYRDTSQDILAVVPFDAGQALGKLRLLLGQQYRDGHANHYFFPHEGWEPVTSVHSDDHLWPALAAWDLLAETGDPAFLHAEVPYYDGGQGTVYEHLKAAIDFTASKLGPNGFPLMLRSDWNDQLFRVCREGRGESIWTAMQLGLVLQRMVELAVAAGHPEDVAKYEAMYAQQRELVNRLGWDGRWFRRAIMDDGRFLGSDEHDEAKIWLNAQTWAVLSGMADPEKGRQAMDSVRELLDTELGIKKIHPSISTFPDPADPLTNYNKGTGENGAVFCHANTWAIIAECLLGRGDLAYKYYRQLLPNVAMDKAGLWRYKAEPYVYASNLFGPESDKFGLANVSWLTGTAAWMYVAATQYILGIKPVLQGLSINPCIPAEWEGFSVKRKFRGCDYEITVRNESRVCRGVKSITVDGQRLEGTVLPAYPGRSSVRVEVVM